jgi:predicted NUDIX family NTP pyrophosphohydrolase
VRAEYVSAWQHAENRLAAASAVLHELPETSQPALLQLLHNLKSLQQHRYQQVHQLMSPSPATIKLIEEATEEQRLLAQQIADFISHARADRARRQAAMIASAEARRVHEQALAALLREPARAARRRRAEFDEDEEDDDHYDRRKRRSKASNRRRGHDDSGSFLSGSVKALGGTGIMLAIAVVFNGIQFAERIFGLNMPSSQFVAHEQPDVDSRGSVATVNARPIVAEGDKPFVDRLEAGQPAVAPTASVPPAEATTPTTPINEGVPGRAAPFSGATPTERAATPPKVKVAAKVANPEVAEAGSPAKQKPVMTASVRPPPANPVRAVSPAAPRVEEGDGLYVVVLSTHKEAGAAQEEFAELQKKFAGILGSKQSEVQIISGQTGSWHRLVATPASTKAAANEICNDLRSAGYGRCWVKAY